MPFHHNIGPAWDWFLETLRRPEHEQRVITGYGMQRPSNYLDYLAESGRYRDPEGFIPVSNIGVPLSTKDTSDDSTYPHVAKASAATEAEARRITAANSTTVRAEFNAIYQEVKTGRGALTEDEFNAYILDQITSLLLSPEYQGSSYFEAGDKLSVTSEKTALGAAKKALQDWYTALDPSGKGDGDSLRWLGIIEDYGVEKRAKPTTVIVDAGADAGDANIDAELAQLLEDPSLYQALWQQERGIPATGRTMYEKWLADQWRTPAINYILGVDPQIGGLSEDLTYKQYLESIRGEPVGGLDPDLVRAFEALDRTGQGSAFERFRTVPGLGNIEQYLYRSTLIEQGIPPWLATNLTQQRYAGQDLYRIGEGLESGAPSFFSSLIDMDPLAFGGGGGPGGVSAMAASPFGSQNPLFDQGDLPGPLGAGWEGDPVGFFPTEEEMINPESQLLLALQGAGNQVPFEERLRAMFAQGGV